MVGVAQAGVRRGRPGHDLESVLRGAVKVFNERGYDGTSMEDLSRELGITKSAIYHHVTGKEELLRLAVDRALDGLFALLDEISGLEAPAITRLEELARRSVLLLVAELPFVTLLLRVRGNTAAERRALERRRSFDAAVADLVTQARDEGDLRPDLDPALAARLLYGVINSVVEWYRPRGGRPSELADSIVAVAFDGLRLGRLGSGLWEPSWSCWVPPRRRCRWLGGAGSRRRAQGADILVHQVADLDYLRRHGTDEAELARMAALHTDIGQVGGVAERAGVRELILSHFLPASPDAVTDWAGRAGQGFSGKTTAGHDGMRRSVRLWQYATGVPGGSMSCVSLFGGRLRPSRAQRAGAGRPAQDDEIVTALYRQYREPLMTFVLRLTAGNRAQAEDVVQETMVRAWREAAKLDLSEPSLMPWLTTVARRIVIDDHRRRQARPIETADADLANLPAEDDTAAADRRLLVADALRALSPLHRQVLNETILRDRTVNQAAQELGIPVGTVKSRVYYALRALQVVLAEHGVPP